ncbi:hypothetical protein, partial [Aeromonas caviae]|uniref:hypothetical protein n=1 Tax=Aeromonas caviae TaxID=648 RepID=UPI002B460B4D
DAVPAGRKMVIGMMLLADRHDVISQAVLQLGDAVEELINQLVGLLQSGGHSRGMHGVFAHGGSVSKEQDQASRKVGSRDDRLIFPVSILFR